MAEKTWDGGQSLLPLLHYCKAQAREGIEECALPHSSFGMKEC